MGFLRIFAYMDTHAENKAIKAAFFMLNALIFVYFDYELGKPLDFLMPLYIVGNVLTLIGSVYIKRLNKTEK